MRKIVSVSLPEEMAEKLGITAKNSGKSKSEVIKEALRSYLWEERFHKVRKAITRKAKEKGIVTDEDVFKAMS
jgi:CopG family transcriptional regulator/antitoxin EndoAI